jgi:hypothetical protein
VQPPLDTPAAEVSNDVDTSNINSSPVTTDADPNPGAHYAPKISPSCAPAIIGSPVPGDPFYTVHFTNHCGIRIKVAFSDQPSNIFDAETQILEPDEDSLPSNLGEGMTKTPFVVCSYANVPDFYDCEENH